MIELLDFEWEDCRRELQTFMEPLVALEYSEVEDHEDDITGAHLETISRADLHSLINRLDEIINKSITRRLRTDVVVSAAKESQ